MSVPDEFNIRLWLAELGIEQYAPAFESNHITCNALIELTAEDLKEIGVNSLGHRKLLLQEIRRMGFSPIRRQPPKIGACRQSSPAVPTPIPQELSGSGVKVQHVGNETSLAPELEQGTPGLPPAAPQSAVEMCPNTKRELSGHARHRRPRKTIWQRILSSKFFFGSIAMTAGITSVWFWELSYA